MQTWSTYDMTSRLGNKKIKQFKTKQTQNYITIFMYLSLMQQIWNSENNKKKDEATEKQHSDKHIHTNKALTLA